MLSPKAAEWGLTAQCYIVQVLWQGYTAAMREAEFDESTPLYVASGLLTYGATQGKLQACLFLRLHVTHVPSNICCVFPCPFCSSVNTACRYDGCGDNAYGHGPLLWRAYKGALPA